MTVKIFDLDAFERMGRVEGEWWKQLQLRDPTSPFGFFAYKMAWDVLVQEGYVERMTPHEVMSAGMVPGVERGDGAIYGEGGYDRYFVRADGEIVFSKSHAGANQLELAQQEGFTVV